MTDSKDTGQGGGEVLISGLDTGPSETERGNRSPTVKLMKLGMGSAQAEQEEPDDEDG